MAMYMQEVKFQFFHESDTAHRKREHVHNASLPKALHGPTHRRETLLPMLQVAAIALIVCSFLYRIQTAVVNPGEPKKYELNVA